MVFEEKHQFYARIHPAEVAARLDFQTDHKWTQSTIHFKASKIEVEYRKCSVISLAPILKDIHVRHEF